MKIINLSSAYETRKNEIDKLSEELEKITNPLFPILQRRYGCDKDLVEIAYKKLAMLLGTSGRKFIGTHFLDLGCGARGSLTRINRPENPYNGWEPWLPRFIHELGGKVIGVDIGELEGEEFPYIQNRDLLLPNSLAEIKTGSIDIAYAFRLFDSPTIKAYRYSTGELKRNILGQLERALRPDGVFAYSPSCDYEKKPVFAEDELRRAA